MLDELTTLLDNYAEKEGCDAQSALRDSLTDLLRLADRRGLDFEKAVTGALDVYVEEMRG